MKLIADWTKNTTVQSVFAAFAAHGFDIYLVGGSVRNALLNLPVTDLDFSTSATPQETLNLAKQAGFKSIPTGLEHGTITVLVDGHSFEITSFRKDVETHGRRAVVEFSTDILDDARRRDFTMNAIYADQYGTVQDPLGGLDDLRARRVRFIEDANTRIQEDYLRILRYFRFHAQYGDQDAGLDAEALAGISANVEGLNLISKERIGSELRKLLSVDDPLRTVAAMEASGVLMQVLPGATCLTLGPLIEIENSLGLTADWMRRLISLGGQDCVENLRLSKSEAKRIQRFERANKLAPNAKETAYRFGRETALDLSLLTAASLAQHPPTNLLDEIEFGVHVVFPIRAHDLPDTLKGKEIGDRLRFLEDEWIASGFTASKSELLAK